MPPFNKEQVPFLQGENLDQKNKKPTVIKVGVQQTETIVVRKINNSNSNDQGDSDRGFLAE